MMTLTDQDELILVARMGSFAYNLQTPDSDVDLLGCYLAPSAEFFNLRQRKEGDWSAVVAVEGGDDYQYHELGKFCRMVLSSNPTALELLFVDEYRLQNAWGKIQVANRDAFLSERARSAYKGYAYKQFDMLTRRQEEGKEGYASNLKNRYAKHTRHSFRILRQGAELLTTGVMRLRCTDEERDELFALGKEDPSVIIPMFEAEVARFEELPCVLPAEPDEERINDMVVEIRKARL